LDDFQVVGRYYEPPHAGIKVELLCMNRNDCNISNFGESFMLTMEEWRNCHLESQNTAHLSEITFTLPVEMVTVTSLSACYRKQAGVEKPRGHAHYHPGQQPMNPATSHLFIPGTTSPQLSCGYNKMKSHHIK
jgi:hypothetical protein